VKHCEKNSDRAGASRAGAVDADEGLSERRGLQVVRMNASALRYQPRPDRNTALRERIIALPQRHRRYGVGMIHLKLRQTGECIKLQASRAAVIGSRKLHIRRRRRKKIPVADRQPLIRPGRANEIWSMDFVFGPNRIRSHGEVPGDR